MEVQIRKLVDGAKIPTYATQGSAGVDLRADIQKTDDPITNRILIEPGETYTIGTGLSIAIPQGYEAQIRTRSGMAARGLIVANSPGTIDSDYRGEVKIMIYNRGRDPQFIYNDHRIAQMIFSKVETAFFVEVEELSETKRGDGGFGSTGEE